MLIPPKYTLTPKISELIASIEASKSVIQSINLPKEIEANIRRQTTLKSSLFSARIEGNPLTLEELNSSSKSQSKAEVFNLLRALNWIYKRRKKDIQVQDILTLHQLVLEGIKDPSEIGRFRTTSIAIFNKAGIAIYLAPPARNVTTLIYRLIKYIKHHPERFVPIKACLAHYLFEKIHPFQDGNGRTGRLLLHHILSQSDLDFKNLVPLDEYLEHHRQTYYKSLEEPEKDVTEYLEFMLTAIESIASHARQLILAKRNSAPEDTLLPRRLEILELVRDHKLINFDSIKRRFDKINDRTLRHDLKKLQDSGFIQKRGSTRGVYYQVAKQ